MRWGTNGAMRVLALATALLSAGCDVRPPTEQEAVERDYVRFCAVCHGVDGQTVAGSAAPQLASQDMLALADDDFLRASIAYGRPGAGAHNRPGVKMSAFAKEERGPLTDVQIDALVQHLRGWQTVPSVDLDDDWRADGDVAAGELIYAEDCASCHGPDGWAGEVPRLAGATLQAHASDDFIRQTILRGRSGTEMPAFDYDDEAMEALISFIRTLGGEEPGAARRLPGSKAFERWLEPARVLAAASVHADAPQVTITTWRSDRDPGPGGVLEPVDMQVDADGTFVVLDRALNRAQRMTPDGQVLAVYGAGPGEGPGELDGPLGVALDPERGRVVIADTLNRRIVVFTDDGGHQVTWPEGHPRPEALTIGLDGRVYAYDRARSALVGRWPDGEDAVVVPVQRTLSDIAELPSGLATSPGGSLFFAAENPHRNADNVLYEYSAEGETLAPRTRVQWRMRDVSFDGGGEMLLLDGTEHRLVSRFDRATGEGGRAVALERGAVALAGGAAGRAFVTKVANDLGPAAIFEVDWRSGAELARLVLPLPEPSWTGGPLRIAAAGDGDIFVVDQHERLLRWDRHGLPVGQWRSPGLVAAQGTGDGGFIAVSLRAAATEDDPADPDTPPPGMRAVRMQRFAPSMMTWPGDKVRPTWTFEALEPITKTPPTTILAVAHDPTGGHSYMLDGAGGRIIAIGDGGEPLGDWDLPRLQPGPGWLDLTWAGGRLLALHGGSRTILRIDPGDGPDPLYTTETIALDATLALPLALSGDGSVMVVARLDRTVALLDGDGALQAQWSLPEPVIGRGGAPTSIVLASAGTMFVADLEERAVHRLEVGVRTSALHLPLLARDPQR